VWSLPGSTTATLCSPALHPAPCRTTLQGSFIKCQHDHTHTHCWRNCTGCWWSSASPTNWPYWRSRYGIRQHRCISVGTSEHAAPLGHCSHRLFHFSMCRSEALTLANDPSAALHLRERSKPPFSVSAETKTAPAYLNQNWNRKWAFNFGRNWSWNRHFRPLLSGMFYLCRGISPDDFLARWSSGIVGSHFPTNIICYSLYILPYCCRRLRTKQYRDQPTDATMQPVVCGLSSNLILPRPPWTQTQIKVQGETAQLDVRIHMWRAHAPTECRLGGVQTLQSEDYDQGWTVSVNSLNVTD